MAKLSEPIAHAAGLSPSQSPDYWATEDTDETYGAFTQSEWAEIRDVSRQAVVG